MKITGMTGWVLCCLVAGGVGFFCDRAEGKEKPGMPDFAVDEPVRSNGRQAPDEYFIWQGVPLEVPDSVRIVSDGKGKRYDIAEMVDERFFNPPITMSEDDMVAIDAIMWKVHRDGSRYGVLAKVDRPQADYSISRHKDGKYYSVYLYRSLNVAYDFTDVRVRQLDMSPKDLKRVLAILDRWRFTPKYEEAVKRAE